MANQLRVGIVGLRRGAILLHVFRHHPEADVVAVCDTDPARLEAVGREYGIDGQYDNFPAFLEHNLDVVVVATPLPVHAEHSIAVLESGRHVICEVPAVNSLAEAEALVRAARASRGTYLFAENCCFWAFVEAWTEMVAAGRLGRVIYMEAEYVHDCRAIMRDAQGRRAWRAEMPPIHYCTHSLGPLLQIAGDRCVTAMGLNSGCNIAPDLGAIDLEVGLFRTAQGVPVKLLCGFSVVREPFFHYYSVYGTRGCLERPRPPAEDVTLAYLEDLPELHGPATLPIGTRHRRAPAHAAAGGHGTAEYAMVNAFVDCLLHGAPPSIDLYRGLDFTLPGICAHLSAQRGGQPVEVPDYR
ncbi:MAG: Gfo/Idh/MocA family oxidoreductase [Armatimonadetes bacterium]|nr:Gfo/Idh/MocA family oxidoreductase [Armatimonadota bacterium]